MARSPEDLANLALSHLVRGTIRSLDDSSPEATQTKAFIELAKESVICEFDWPECRVVAPLVPVSLSATRGWSFSYSEPSDVAKLWGITDGTTSIKPLPYERGMSPDPSSDRAYIYTDQAGAYARYGSSRVSISRFSAEVFELIGIKLAILACMPLTKDQKLKANLTNQYIRELNKVKVSVANAEPELFDIEFVPEVIQVRSS